METTYRLIIQSGPEIGKEYSLDKLELFLGRDPNTDIEIPDPEVSRRHARLVLTGDDYSIEDLGSTNGTVVRGVRIQSLTRLSSGDIIAIGERVSLVYQTILFDPDATAVVPRKVGYQPEIAQPESLFQRPPVRIESQPPVSQPQQPAASTPQPELSKVMPVTPPFTEEAQEPPAAQEVPAAREPAPVLPPEKSFVGKAPAQPKAPKKRRAWVGILLIVGLLILIFCVIPWIIIDITNSYCLFLPGILNAIQPGVCP